MADFTDDLQSLKSSFPFLDIDPNMEQINQFLNCHSFMPFSDENYFTISSQATDQFPGNLAENFQGIFHQSNINQNILQVSQSTVTTESESKKRKAVDTSDNSYENSSLVSKTKRKTNIFERRKRVKSNEKQEEKSKEVVHVRARRGQATDSHSLAERVRRKKINERLRCLQDIVPGCYKTMGMAVMLDEIINYVQSLQNQVEFLSMKLTAASTFYNFNSESDAIETMQRAKAYESKEIERLMREGHGGFGCSSLP